MILFYINQSRKTILKTGKNKIDSCFLQKCAKNISFLSLNKLILQNFLSSGNCCSNQNFGYGLFRCHPRAALLRG
jgi:hypothetical protein